MATAERGKRAKCVGSGARLPWFERQLHLQAVWPEQVASLLQASATSSVKQGYSHAHLLRFVVRIRWADTGQVWAHKEKEAQLEERKGEFIIWIPEGRRVETGKVPGA